MTEAALDSSQGERGGGRGKAGDRENILPDVESHWSFFAKCPAVTVSVSTR